jgi:hypothetical protein
MINVVAALEIAAAAASKESPIQLIDDAKTLYGVYQKAESKSLNFLALGKSGELAPIVAAAARVSRVANELMADKESAEDISELLASLG